MFSRSSDFFFFFFNDTATTEIYTLSLHDALPISPYAPLIPEWGHIAPCFCYHCPFNKTFPECELACAEDLRSEEHTSELQSQSNLVCRLLLEKKKKECTAC